MSHKPKSVGCSNCQQQSLLDIDLSKLGRCRDCMVKACLFSIISLVFYIWQLNANGSKSVYTIAALFALIAFSSLSLLHFLALAWRQFKKRKLTK